MAPGFQSVAAASEPVVVVQVIQVVVVQVVQGVLAASPGLAVPAPMAPAAGAMVMGMVRSLAPASMAILGAMTVSTPSGDSVDVTVSGLTPAGRVTRRRNLSSVGKKKRHPSAEQLLV